MLDGVDRMNVAKKVSVKLEDLEEKRHEYEGLLSKFIPGIDGLYFLPPVPNQKLLSSNGLNRSILPIVNDAILNRTPLLDMEKRKVIIPFCDGDVVIGICVAEINENSRIDGKFIKDSLAVATNLFVEKTFLEKTGKIDPETGLFNISAFLHRLEDLVQSHVSGNKGGIRKGMDSTPEVPAEFLIGLVRILPGDCYPVNMWSADWHRLKKYAGDLGAEMPDDVFGALLPGGEIALILPGTRERNSLSFLKKALNLDEDAFHASFLGFPADLLDSFEVESPKALISLIFERLWMVLNTTVTTPTKQIWYWKDLCNLGVTPDVAIAYGDNIINKINVLEKFACFAMKFKEENLDISLISAFKKLRDAVKELFPAGSLLYSAPAICQPPMDCSGHCSRDHTSLWPGYAILAVVPGINDKMALELIEPLLSRISREVGKALNVGISFYPFYDFSKEEVVQNSLKALVHAGLVNDHGYVFVDSVTFNVSGDNYFNQGKLELARVEYEKGTKINPRNLNLLNSLGVCYGELGMLEKAEEVFGKVLKLEPENFMANFNLGCLRLRQKKLDEAEEMIFNAIQSNPASAEVHFSMGRIKFEKEDYANATFHLEKAIASRDSWRAARKLLAESYEKLGNKKKAMEHYKHILRLNPADAMSLHALGCLYGEEARNLEVAISLCEKAVGFDEKNDQYRLTLAKLLFQAGDLRGALGHLENLLRMDGKNDDAIKLKKEIEKRIEKTRPINGKNNIPVQLGNPDLEE